MFEKGKILKKFFDLMETTFFVQTSDTGQILPETVFLHQSMSHKQLN